MVSRRRFLGMSASAPFGLGAASTRAAEPRIRRHVTLGRTGLRVSDIGFGSSRSDDPDLVRHAFERGVTYFDTAESYRFGGAERAIGKAMRGVRDRVVIASKTKAWWSETRGEMMRALEGSLERLRTDYLDVYFNHAVNDVERLQNEEWGEFTERAKEQGKIRFRGVSGHGGDLVRCLDYAMDNDLADVVLVAYNFAQDPDFYDRLRHTFHFVDLQPELPRALEKAKRKGVGVIAMKTLMGARLNDMRPYERDGVTFSQAAFRWVLSSPGVDSLVVSMTGERQIDEYVAASGEPRVGRAGAHLLELYARLQDARYCRHGCNACEASCPHGVQIAEVLRTRMYDVDYGDRSLAAADYAAIAGDAGACLHCAHRSCADACPYGIPVPVVTRDAALRLG